MTVREIPAGSPNTASPWLRWAVTGAAALLAAGVLAIIAATFVTSFDAQAAVARDRGAVNPHLAWAIPLAIDGMIVVGSAAAWITAMRDNRWHPFPMAVVAVAGAMSIVTNVAHAATGDWLARALAAVPPVALLAAVELGAWLIRQTVHREVQQSLTSRGRGASVHAETLHLQPDVHNVRSVQVPQGDVQAAMQAWLHAHPDATLEDAKRADIAALAGVSPSTVSRKWDRARDAVEPATNGTHG